MQVPDSFYFNRPAAPEQKKDIGQRRHLGDDSFRAMMAEDRRKTKEVDDDRPKKGEVAAGATEEVDQEDEEFSIFGKTKKKLPNAPVRERPQHNKSKAPFFDQQAAAKNAPAEAEADEEVAEVPIQEYPEDAPLEDYVPPVVAPKGEEPENLTQEQLAFREDPNSKNLRQGKDLPKAHETIVQKQQSTDSRDQQEQVDDIRNNAGYIFVEKKDKKDEERSALFDYGSKSKPKSGETVRTVPTTDGGEAEVVEVPTKEIIKGKQDIKEQVEQPHKDIALPGSKEGKEKFQHTLERAQPELRAATTNDTKLEQPKKKTEIPRENVKQKESESEQELQETAPKSKTEATVDPRTVAFVPDGALPKDQGQVALNIDKPVEKPPLAAKLQEIVDQIVKEIYTINNQGKSETTIILQHPPLFNGVKVTIETFEHARNELNITFSNLTGPGKRVLDENLASLKTALEQNDSKFVVHQLRTTTLDEVPQYIAEAQQQRSQDQDQEQQQQHKQKQDDQEEEEKK